MSQDMGATFRALHTLGDPFILANAWDRGSAQMLAALGAQAIGTSSAAHAFTLGRPDMGHVSRDEALAHAQDLISAVNLPVSGDFENGFGEAPDTVAETVRLSAEVGLAGICVEDTALPDAAPYPFDLAVERMRAGVAAARALGKDFFFLARADGLLTGEYGFEEALRRVQAFEQAGVDGVYIPGLQTADEISTLCKAVNVPVNVLIMGAVRDMTKAQLVALGVARLSLGSQIARVTHAAIQSIGEEMFGAGGFTGLKSSASGADIDALLQQGAKSTA